MSKLNDNIETPEYAVKPILKYLKPNSRIWCPFDKEESNYVKILKKAGHDVVNTHIGDDGIKSNCFFKYCELPTLIEMGKFDYIISNPPFSLKNEILKKLYELGIPFMMLLPLTALESKERNKLFSKYKLELLVFDKRIQFLNQNYNNRINTSYFCWKVLPQQLMFEKLERK